VFYSDPIACGICASGVSPLIDLKHSEVAFVSSTKWVASQRNGHFGRNGLLRNEMGTSGEMGCCATKWALRANWVAAQRNGHFGRDGLLRNKMGTSGEMGCCATKCPSKAMEWISAA